MKNKIKIIIGIIIVIILIIINTKVRHKIQVYDDIFIFNMFNEQNNDKYQIESQKALEINIFNNINRKIAPGCNGQFTIMLNGEIEDKTKIIISEKSNKPQNLKFKINNSKYKSLEDMKDKIKDELIENKKVVINWKWLYEENEECDISDTIDGIKANEYIFEIKII